MSAASVDKCEQGLKRAGAETDLAVAMRLYHEECADLYVQPGCRQAFLTAASAPQTEQVTLVADGCRRAYCPVLPSASGLEICKPGFGVTLESAQRAWPPLQEAILAYDGKGLAPRVTRFTVAFYSHVLALQGKSPPAAP
jgi:hypothetical protein